MNEAIKTYLATIGRKGGATSRRTLSRQQAQTMVRIREARRAYRAFFAQCFWSYDPNLQIAAEDIPWVVDTLQKHGGRRAWEVASRLCH